MVNLPINPATRISIWLGFAVAVQAIGPTTLLLVTVLSVVGLIAMRVTGALSMLRRVRWLLLSLLLIYSFATPGDPAFPALGFLSPSLQGLHGGTLQAWRLALLLSTLALLLHACPRENLLSGIYILLRPLRPLGLDPERVAVRLWLTLHYAEQQPRKSIHSWWHDLRAATEPAPDIASHINLELSPFTWRDTIALMAAALTLGVALW